MTKAALKLLNKEIKMKAYKATINGKCKTITFEEGKTYTFNGKLEMCSQGFHFCKNPKDTLQWYDYSKNFQLMEIEVLGVIIDSDNKSLTNKFKVLRFFTQSEMFGLLNIESKYDEKGNLIYPF